MNRFLESIRLARLLARPLAMTAIWLTATVFFGMAYFTSARQVSVEETIIFTAAFACAAAVSAAIALLVGGTRRWALEAALPMALLIGAPIAMAGALTWLAPGLSWKLQTVNFFPYGGRIPMAVLGIARQIIPTGAVLGIAIGAISGLMILLARYRPRLVRWFVAGLLLSCVIGFVHINAFDRVVDFVVQTRLQGINSLRTIRLELACAIGATAGAFVGAVVAYGAVRLSERSRVSLGLRGGRNVES